MIPVQPNTDAPARHSGTGGQTRRFLLLGFGGLLLLLAFTGLDALSVLTRIQSSNARIREDYVNRDRILQQLRSDIYLSGTYVRDFLLEPDPARADLHREEFDAARARIQSMLAAYDRILRGEERDTFKRFSREVVEYFDSLRPAFRWNANQRRTLGYAFMTTSLLPRRQTIVRLADQIGQVNQRQLEAGNRQVSDLFSSFRKSLVLLLIITFIGGFVLAMGSIYRILRLESEAAVRFDEIVQARAALRELSARLVEVQESERRALARELHDEVGQSLSALLLSLGNLAAYLSPEDNSAARDQLHEIRRLGERTVAVVRDMSLLLRPPMLDDLGLLPALQWQAREVSRTKNLLVEVHAESVSEDLPDEHKTCIYRIVQEALFNVTRHARAGSVRIDLVQKKQNLLLTIQDDGKGFVPERDKGVGLLGMEERVKRLGGTFRVTSAPGKGALIEVELSVA